MPNATDDGWKANGRPVSTIARSFSAALDDAFFMTPELDNLSQSVAQKQQALSTQKSELEELEARLRETEERLKNQQPSTSFSSSTLPAPAGSLTNHRNNNPRLRSDLDGAFDPPDDTPSRISVNAQHGDDGSDTERRQDGRSSRARPENHPPELSRGANPRSKNLEMRGQQTAESGSGNKDSAASLREKSRNKV